MLYDVYEANYFDTLLVFIHLMTKHEEGNKMVLANTKKELKKQIRELKEAVVMLTDQINRLDDSIADDELKLALIDTSRRVEYRSMREAYVRKLSESDGTRVSSSFNCAAEEVAAGSKS